MTDFIGASIGDLENVSANFQNLTGTVQDSGKTVVSTCNNAVETLRSETQTAQTTCINSIEGMKNDFTKVISVLEAAQYVGQNAETARQAGSDMDARCSQAVADMNNAFDQFRSQIDILGTDLQDIATSYDQYTAAAGESTTSMSDAIRVQRENLDAAMRGMTY